MGDEITKGRLLKMSGIIRYPRAIKRLIGCDRYRVLQGLYRAFIIQIYTFFITLVDLPGSPQFLYVFETIL